MTTGHVFMATSLDGFVAREDHSLDWLDRQNTEGEDHGYQDFIATMDGLIMGSGSLRTLLSFDSWPYEKPVIVMSNSMTEDNIPLHLREKVSLTQKGPKELMASLEQDGWTRAYVDGGKIVQSFLREGLIADMAITLIPVLIGDGIPLFDSLDADIELKLVSSQSFNSGLVQNTYQL